jgi:creatinine amidohydrolase
LKSISLTNILGAETLSRINNVDLIVIPFGSIEYHGPHAPIGTDSLIAQELGTRIATRMNAILGPLIAYTTCPVTTRNNPGTLSIDTDIMTAYIENIFRGLFKHGAKGILAINAHDGNIDPIQRASDRLFFEFRDSFILSINWWETLPTSMIESMGLFSEGGGHGHGGPLETSAAWAVEPDSVILSSAEDIDPSLVGQQDLHILKSGGRLPKWPGYGGRISESSIEKGKTLLHLAEDRIVELLEGWVQMSPEKE